MMIQPLRSKRRWKDFDWLLLAAAACLSIVSLVEIYSSTMAQPMEKFFMRQLAWVCVGIVLLFIVAAIDYHLITDQHIGIGPPGFRVQKLGHVRAGHLSALGINQDGCGGCTRAIPLGAAKQPVHDFHADRESLHDFSRADGPRGPATRFGDRADVFAADRRGPFHPWCPAGGTVFVSIGLCVNPSGILAGSEALPEGTHFNLPRS